MDKQIKEGVIGKLENYLEILREKQNGILSMTHDVAEAEALSAYTELDNEIDEVKDLIEEVNLVDLILEDE